MKKKVINIKYLLIIFFLLIIVGIIIFLINSKNINYSKYNEVYALLESSNLNYCDGLTFYQDKEITYEKIDNTTKLCLAYRNLDNNMITNNLLEKYKKKDYCLIGKDKIQLTDEEKGTCQTKIVDNDALNIKYKDLFGKSIENNESFDLNGLESCIYDEKNNTYTCATKYEKNIVVGWDPTYYRLIKKVVEKEDQIIIYDYILIINNEICFKDNSNNNSDEECTRKLSEKEVNNRFIKKYGNLYKHIFIKDKDTYFWKSSSPTS